jgi:hypothetical protein
MPVQTLSLISPNDYNSIQNLVAQVLGTGNAEFGYGQLVTSNQLTSKSLISIGSWANLRSDMIHARWHQTGTDPSSSLPSLASKTLLTAADINLFSTMAATIAANKLVKPPVSQATRTTLVTGTLSSAWNGTSTHTVSVDFSTADMARFYFNSGSTIEFYASRTGGSTNAKNTSWSTMLTNMQTIVFNNSSTTCSGTGSPAASIGFYQLTLADQTIFTKTTENSTYNPNTYTILARKNSDSSQIIFTIRFTDAAAGNVDENVDGSLISTVQSYRATGVNVEVPVPAGTSSFPGGSTVVVTPPTLPLTPTYSVTANKNSIDEGGTGVVVTITTTNVPVGTNIYYVVSGANITTSDLNNPSPLFADSLHGYVVITSSTVNGVTTYSGSTPTLVAAADNTSEGVTPESFILTFTKPNGGTISSPSISIGDLSKTPAVVTPPATELPVAPGPSDGYSVDQHGVTIISEGTTGVTYDITTPSTFTGSILYWKTRPSTGTNTRTSLTGDDFEPSANSSDGMTGTVAITNHKGTLVRAARADRTSENTESFSITFQETLNGPDIPGLITSPVMILSTSSDFSYGVSITTTSSLPLAETAGTTRTINFSVVLTMLNVPVGTQLYFTWGGTATYGTDFTLVSGPAFTASTNPAGGTFVTTGSSMTWNFVVVEDHLTETNETVVWEARESSYTSPIQASATATINNTSSTPVYTLTITPADPAIIDEDTSNTFTLTCTVQNINVNAIMYLVSEGTAKRRVGAITDWDYEYVSGPSIGTDGAISITSTSLVWTWRVRADLFTEGATPESVLFSLRPISASNTTGIVYSNTVSILDSSLTPPTGTMTITSGTLATSPYLAVNEGTELTVTFANANVPAGSVYYIKLNPIQLPGSTSIFEVLDFDYPLPFSPYTGAFAVTSSSLVWKLTVSNDYVTESSIPEQFTLSVYTSPGFETATRLCTSNIVQVADTSLTQSGAVIFRNAGTFTWDVPAGVTVFKVIVWGGGGGGGGYQGNDNWGSSGAGGGGGARVSALIPVGTGTSKITKPTFTIGRGGAATTAGASTTFDTATGIKIVAGGGSGGYYGYGSTGVNGGKSTISGGTATVTGLTAGDIAVAGNYVATAGGVGQATISHGDNSHSGPASGGYPNGGNSGSGYSHTRSVVPPESGGNGYVKIMWGTGITPG